MSECTHYGKGYPPGGRQCGWCAIEKTKKKDNEIERLRRDHLPHMCRMDHEEIRHANSGEDERCPLCIALDESFQLRAETQELEERLAIRRKEIDEKVAPSHWHHITDAQIERLRKWRQLYKDTARRQWLRATENQDRIEELTREPFRIFSEDSGHHITDAQIDAAWTDAIFATRPDEERTEFLEARQLGIVRCEGEGIIEGKTWHEDNCEKCNGHGWMIGGEDE